MDQCLDCTLPAERHGRCFDCAAEVEETPGWTRAPKARSPRKNARKLCAESGCDRLAEARGLCSKHYERAHRPGRARNPDGLCAGGCGKPMHRGRGSLPVGIATCRACRGHRTPAPLADVICQGCGKTFHPWSRDTRFCSLGCFHRSKPVRPPECATDGCSEPHRKGSSYCLRCEELKWPRDPAKARASWRAKNHRRRSQRRETLATFDHVTPQFELTLRVKAKRCPLCGVKLIDEPFQHASKELDHMVPLNVGGTHTTGNVRIICRLCNLRRPDDGSDYTGPVTLWATA